MGERWRAEDVVQEVYLQAWKSFHRFEPGTNCRAVYVISDLPKEQNQQLMIAMAGDLQRALPAL